MFQEITVIGNLGSDPEMRYTPAGKAVTSFSVAANRKYTGSDGQEVKETAWFRVSAWDKLAEIVSQYKKKGDLVMVKGRLTVDPATGGPRVWVPDNGGSARASFEVNASMVLFLSSKQEAAAMAGAGVPETGDEPF